MHLETMQCKWSALINMHWLEESRRQPSYIEVAVLFWCSAGYSSPPEGVDERKRLASGGRLAMFIFILLLLLLPHPIVFCTMNYYQCPIIFIEMHFRLMCVLLVIALTDVIALLYYTRQPEGQTDDACDMQTDGQTVSCVFGAAGVGATCTTHSLL